MKAPLFGLVALTVLMATVLVFFGTNDTGTVRALVSSRTYTLDADFDEGVLVNANHDVPNTDQLQLNATLTTFPFIWIAASSRGTIIKIDTATGTILGEYLSAPGGRGRNPSRTTVDLNGNVWSGNRAESTGGQGSVVQIGLEENLQCQDRNGNTVIDTSTGLGDIRPWTNPGGVDDNGGVSSADDECIIKYVRVGGDNIRHVSVDANNNVWTAGNFGSDNLFNLVDGSNGNILASFDVGCGGYGGLVDGNGVLWSANRGPGPVSLLRYDTNNTITTADDTSACLTSPNGYGLGIDSNGNIWHSQWTSNSIRKFDPAGNLFAGFPKTTGGASNDRGVAVTLNDDNVWVANSGGNNVSRLDNNGNVLKVITVGTTPTGVAVDADGKVWATNLSSNTASRIDPNAGGDGLGAVDLTVNLGAGAGPYNYSDMTGQIALSITAPQGTWTVIFDSEQAGTEWGTVSWNTLLGQNCPAAPADQEPPGTSITARARSADTQVALGAATYVNAPNGVDIAPPNGRFLQVEVKLTPNANGESPIVCDVTIQTSTQVCVDHEGNLLRWCLERDVVQPGPTATPAPSPTPHTAPNRWSR